MTTLDTASRLGRFIGTELFGSNGLGLTVMDNRYVSTIVLLVLAGALAHQQLDKNLAYIRISQSTDCSPFAVCGDHMARGNEKALKIYTLSWYLYAADKNCCTGDPCAEIHTGRRLFTWRYQYHPADPCSSCSS